MKKYYHISIFENGRMKGFVIDVHPISDECLGEILKDGSGMALISWQEITKAEYDRYVEIQDRVFYT